MANYPYPDSNNLGTRAARPLGGLGTRHPGTRSSIAYVAVTVTTGLWAGSTAPEPL